MSEPFNEMAIFARIVEEGSFTAAAKSLGRSKAFVSQQLSQLETMLGTELLFRSTRKLSLTEAGKVYLGYCQDMTKAAEEAKRSIEALQGEMQGSIAVSATNSFGELIMSELLLSFQQQYPKISIELDLSDEIRDLKTQGIDLCIRGNNPIDDDLVAIPLLQWRMITVATPQYLAEHGTPITPDELKQHNCIGEKTEMNHMGWPYMIDNQFKRVQVSGDFSAPRNPLIKRLALQGRGIAWMPAFVIEKEVREGSLVKVLEDFYPPAFTFYLVYAYQKAMPLRQRRLIDFIKEWFAEPVML
jgi:DNA-binding transcriptional LysR family regulator